MYRFNLLNNIWHANFSLCLLPSVNSHDGENDNSCAPGFGCCEWWHHSWSDQSWGKLETEVWEKSMSKNILPASTFPAPYSFFFQHILLWGKFDHAPSLPQIIKWISTSLRIKSNFISVNRPCTSWSIFIS